MKVRCRECFDWGHSSTPRTCPSCNNKYWVDQPTAGGEMVLWKVSDGHLPTGGRDVPDNHPDSPFRVHFRSRDSCLDAIEAWLKVLEKIDPKAFAPNYPLGICNREDLRKLFGVWVFDDEQRFEWRLEDLRCSREPTREDESFGDDDESVVAYCKLWFRPFAKARVQVFTKDGEPAGHANQDVCLHEEWIPVTKSCIRDHGLPDLDAEPMELRSYQCTPIRVVIHLGD